MMKPGSFECKDNNAAYVKKIMPEGLWVTCATFAYFPNIST